MFATVSDLVVGGWLIDHLIGRGYEDTRVRQTVLVGGMLVGLAWSLPSLIAPKGGTGTIGGIMNFANNAMAIVAPITTGAIVTATGSFKGAFLVAGVVLLVGNPELRVVLGRLEPIPEPGGLIAAPGPALTVALISASSACSARSQGGDIRYDPVGGPQQCSAATIMPLVGIYRATNPGETVRVDIPRLRDCRPTERTENRFDPLAHPARRGGRFLRRGRARHRLIARFARLASSRGLRVLPSSRGPQRQASTPFCACSRFLGLVEHHRLRAVDHRRGRLPRRDGPAGSA